MIFPGDGAGPPSQHVDQQSLEKPRGVTPGPRVQLRILDWTSPCRSKGNRVEAGGGNMGTWTSRCQCLRRTLSRDLAPGSRVRVPAGQGGAGAQRPGTSYPSLTPPLDSATPNLNLRLAVTLQEFFFSG